MKQAKAELYKHKGCDNCERNCQFNSKVATKIVSQRSEGHLFPCHSVNRRGIK